MQKAKAEDETSEIDLVWFNQPFIEKLLEKNDQFYLAGKLNHLSNKPQILSPEYEIINTEDPTHIARISPVYPLTEGIKQKWIRGRIKWLVDKLEYITDIENEFDEILSKDEGLLDFKTALKTFHFPETQESLAHAKRRLAFDEMLKIQIILESQRKKRSKLNSPILKTDASHLNTFIKNLPFEPTTDQVKSIEEIIANISTKSPMKRLLQGDVGSGKTLVAIAASLHTVKSNHKVVVMAPTTVLAEQLYKNFDTFLSPFKIKIKLITSSGEIQNDDFATNDFDVIIGTHALLFKDKTTFNNIGLVIIDEQHRFGVEQRDKLTSISIGENLVPHYLLMTATPIPRTLAITIFGDMDISTIIEKPKDRKPVKTFLVPHKKRADSYKWIEEQVKDKNQVFWICPLIEESETLQTKSVNEAYSELKKIYPLLKIKKLHGQLSNDEKNRLLDEFKRNEFDILVSTSVIEVGIDIPNTNYIVIEGSERFGLAQLHQLRGRVGRADKQSYCLLFLTKETDVTSDAIERLKYFSNETNGLNIAEYDLKRRGPGEVYGKKQSGIPNLKIASIFDLELIEATRKVAKKIVNKK